MSTDTKAPQGRHNELLAVAARPAMQISTTHPPIQRGQSGTPLGTSQPNHIKKLRIRTQALSAASLGTRSTAICYVTNLRPILHRAGSQDQTQHPAAAKAAAAILHHSLAHGSAPNALRSVWPLGVGGRLSTTTKAPGIIYCGKHRSRLFLTAALSFSADTM